MTKSRSAARQSRPTARSETKRAPQNQVERRLQIAVVRYVRSVLRAAGLPDVVWSDPTASVPLPPNSAIVSQMKALGGQAGKPDLFIAVPKGRFHGLFVELKREGRVIERKDGQPRKDVSHQAKVLSDLRKLGYAAEFAVGFDEAKRIIDDYFKQTNYGQTQTAADGPGSRIGQTQTELPPLAGEEEAEDF